MTPTEKTVAELVAPIARELDLSVYDIELAGGVLRVLLDRPGGIDIGSITEATRQLSRALDSADPISGSYTLEISSPGIERTLRTADHFVAAVGSRVKVKTKPDSGIDRRFSGTLEAFEGSTATILNDSGESVEVDLAQIERVRTEFVDTAAPKPGGGTGKSKKNQSPKGAKSGGSKADVDATSADKNVQSKTRSETNS